MRVDPTVHTERGGVAAFTTAVHGTLGWLCREQPVADFGVDAIVELVVDGHTAGRLLGAQIKSGLSWFEEKTPDGWVFRFNDEHAQYWFNYDIPVIVALHDPVSGTLYWQSLSHDVAEETGKNWKVVVPAEQRIDATTATALTKLARPAREEGDPIERRFAKCLNGLPADARDRLQETRDLARAAADFKGARAAERLAELLQAGSPGDVVAAVLAKTPAWWPDSESVIWRLWAAVGAYANEHLLEVHAAECFSRAVDAGATPAGRWRAFSGLTMVQASPDQAKAILVKAAEFDEGKLLADLGLATLDHQAAGGTGPVPLPDSLKRAIDDGTVLTNGTALRFLAEQARATRDLDTAVTWLEALVSAVPGSDSGRTLLARALAQRASEGRSPLHEAEILRARRLAETARAEQRRWGGASEDPAYVLFHTYLLTGDYESAVSVALLPPDGQANEREAGAELLVQAAARIAVQIGHPRADQLASKVTSPVGVAIMEAVRADAQSAEPSERIALWTRVVEMAGDTGLEEAMIALAALAELGTWPLPGLDDLVARNVVAEDDALLLRARADIAAGRRRVGLTRLRQLADRSLAGTAALVQSLIEMGRHAEAVQACDRGAARYGANEFLLRALHILDQTGERNHWRERALLLMSRSTLPRAIREPLRAQLLQDAFDRSDWTAVEQHALAGIAESGLPGALEDGGALNGNSRTGPLPAELVGYAWSLIGARWNARRPDLAERAHRALEPPVHNVAQARLKAALLRRGGWTTGTVEGLLDLVEQFAEDGDFTGRTLGAILIATGEPPHADAEARRSPTELLLPPDLGARLSSALEIYVSRNPDGLLRAADPQEVVNPDSLRTMLEPAARAHTLLRDHVMAGVVPLGLIASQANRPYALVLLQRAAGCIPAAQADPERFDREVKSAQAALDGVVVIDTSGLHVATMTVAGFADLRARFSSVQLPAACHDDIMVAALDVERLRKSSMSIGFEPEFGLRMSTLTPQERDFLRRRTNDLVAAVGLTDIAQVTDLAMVVDLMTEGIDAEVVAQAPAFTVRAEGPWLASLQLALEQGTTLWTDDVVLRNLASDAGIPAFGTLALLHALYDNGLPDTTEEDYRRFVCEYIVDLPLRADLLMEQAKADGWQSRAAAVPFVRPGAWQEPINTLQTFSELVRAVHEHEPSALPGWLMFGICGFAGSASPEEAPVRAAQLTCSVAAHTMGLTRPGLGELLMSAVAGLRQAFALAAIRAAAFTEAEITHYAAPDCLDLLRRQLITLLTEVGVNTRAPGQDIDGIRAQMESLVEDAYQHACGGASRSS